MITSTTKGCPDKANFRAISALPNEYYGQAYTCLRRLLDIPVERDGITSHGAWSGVVVKTMAFHVDVQ
ncbi:hypothetical protein TNCV_52081 [Trichonephila clavipes]|nr:hypothetical protein TNCV_52081 [Trichonephila clavipes]